MSQYTLVLPDIDYGSDRQMIVYPALSNYVDDFDLRGKFFRWGTQAGQAFYTFVQVMLSVQGIAPDFTIEIDTPLIYAIYQTWRSRVFAHYWQCHGLNVIPVLQRSRPETNSPLFTGLFECEVVAVRSPTRGTEQQWQACAEQFLEIHRPELVLHFGTKAGFQVWPDAINLNLR